MPFKAYTHVERLSTEEVEGILDQDRIYITAKVDGSNATLWFEDGAVHAGSRKRELTPDDDNAGFCAWALSHDPEAIILRKYLEANPSKRLFGEWMGTEKRFVGHIKTYDPRIHAKLIVFDVFDDEAGAYIEDAVWRKELEGAGLDPYLMAPVLAVLDHPTEAQIAAIADGNSAYLPDQDRKGEGVVLKCAAYRNRFGRQAHAKLVLDEYKMAKSKPREKPTGQVENDIILLYLTESELSKTAAKVCAATDADAIDKRSAKSVGMFMSMVWKDLLAECPNFVKKLRNPIVDFSALKRLSDSACREYLGL